MAGPRRRRPTPDPGPEMEKEIAPPEITSSESEDIQMPNDNTPATKFLNSEEESPSFVADGEMEEYLPNHHKELKKRFEEVKKEIQAPTCRGCAEDVQVSPVGAGRADKDT